MRLAGIAHLSRERAVGSLRRTGFPADKYDATGSLSLAEGMKQDKIVITTDSAEPISTPGIDVILAVTGNSAAGVRHVLLVGRQGSFIIASC
jgi:predicted homoserine dehydrogenase-like protein